MRVPVAALLAASALAGPLAAEATAHHSLLVREVRASAASHQEGFVELQAYRQGQNGVAGFELVVYSGLLQQAFTMTHDVANPASQATILLGETGVAGADFAYAQLGTMLNPAGGAVCLSEASPPDCAAWGSFSGPLPFPGAGPPAPAISEGLSLTRTTARVARSGSTAPTTATTRPRTSRSAPRLPAPTPLLPAGGTVCPAVAATRR